MALVPYQAPINVPTMNIPSVNIPLPKIGKSQKAISTRKPREVQVFHEPAFKIPEFKNPNVSSKSQTNNFNKEKEKVIEEAKGIIDKKIDLLKKSRKPKKVRLNNKKKRKKSKKKNINKRKMPKKRKSKGTKRKKSKSNKNVLMSKIIPEAKRIHKKTGMSYQSAIKKASKKYREGKL